MPAAAATALTPPVANAVAVPAAVALIAWRLKAALSRLIAVINATTFDATNRLARIPANAFIIVKFLEI